MQHLLASIDDKETAKIERMIGLYNMVPNLIWSAVCLVPISVYCYTLLDSRLFYVFLAVSALPLFFPASFFNFIQISKDSSFYERIGVKFINRFAQNGELLNRFIRKKYPAYKTITVNKTAIQKQLNRTYFFEKFHFAFFLFFSLVTISAIVRKQVNWVLVLFLTNLIYNVYPNLLQQYIRVKLQAIMGRKSNDSTK